MIAEIDGKVVGSLVFEPLPYAINSSGGVGINSHPNDPAVIKTSEEHPRPVIIKRLAVDTELARRFEFSFG